MAHVCTDVSSVNDDLIASRCTTCLITERS
jgi:hypothetical protein